MVQMALPQRRLHRTSVTKNAIVSKAPTKAGLPLCPVLYVHIVRGVGKGKTKHKEMM